MNFVYKAPACRKDLHFSLAFSLSVTFLQDTKSFPWQTAVTSNSLGRGRLNTHETTFLKSNPAFSANGINHFQATGKQGNRMAVPMFHSDCQWMEEGKKRGTKRKKDELEEDERGKE